MALKVALASARMRWRGVRSSCEKRTEGPGCQIQRYRHVEVQITTSLVLTAAVAANAMSARTAMSNDGFFEGGLHETLASSEDESNGCPGCDRSESPILSRYVACDEGEVFVLVAASAYCAPLAWTALEGSKSASGRLFVHI